MSGKLTKEFLKANQVVFFPASNGEAIYVQQRLVKMGIRWKSGADVEVDCKNILKFGLIVQRGTMYIGNQDVFNEYIVCDVRALSSHFDTQTAELTQRIAALETQVAELTATLKPKVLGKLSASANDAVKKGMR